MREKHTQTRIHIITVLYNRRIEEIRSLSEFEQLQSRHHEVGLIIVDNSTDEEILEHNRETASRNEDLRYIECGGNIGLSRAYNRALATIPQTQPFWVMLADDDTWFSPEYLKNGCKKINAELNRAILLSKRAGRTFDDGSRSGERADAGKEIHRDSRDSLQVLCGVVETQRGWISPRTEHAKELAVSSFLKKPKPGVYRDLYPVNSGLFLDGNVIRKVGGFDERLFLDQVDFLMMDRLRKGGIRKIGVLPGKILQSFSGEIGSKPDGVSAENGTDTESAGREKNEIRSSKERWKIFRKDFETYCELTDKPWYYRNYLLGRRRLMIGLQELYGRLKRC